MSNIERFLNIAKQVSFLGDHKHKHGSVIVYKGICKSTGYNQKYKSHPMLKNFTEFPTIHSEVASILKCKDKSILKDCILVNYRQTKDGIKANSRPCFTCQKIMKVYGIKRVIYTVRDGYREEIFE